MSGDQGPSGPLSGRQGPSGPLSGRQGTLVLEVADRGPGLRGVPPEVLFEAFARGDSDDDEPGQGVGLYVVRMLARSLGGEATVAERPGGGTTARVTLPQRRIEDPVTGRVVPVPRARLSH